MSIADNPIRFPGRSIQAAPEAIPLESGDKLDQPTFHVRYAAMPENVRDPHAKNRDIDDVDEFPP